MRLASSVRKTGDCSDRHRVRAMPRSRSGLRATDARTVTPALAEPAAYRGRVDSLLPLRPHVIRDGFHPLDAACNFDRLVDIGLRTDATAQLHHALKVSRLISLDFREGSSKNAAFTVAVNDGAVNILSGCHTLRRRGACPKRGEQGGGEEGGEPIEWSYGDPPSVGGSPGGTGREEERRRGYVCRETRSFDAQFYTTVLGSAVRGVVGRHRA